MSKGGLCHFLGVPHPFDPDHRFITSPVFSPLVLASVRLVLAFYILFVLLFSLIWDSVRDDTGDQFFSFFTNLSYIGLLAYFCASGVQTLVYALRGRYFLEKWPRFLQFLHMLLYATITTFPIIVTVIFWSVLASPDVFDTRENAWGNISVHAMNSGFALFEILFTHAGPLPWIHLLFAEVILACYLGVAYITHATQGFYTYTFLDPQLQGAKLAAYIVGIAAGEAVLFIIVHFVIQLRERISRRRSPPSSEAIDEWEEINRTDTVEV